MVLVQEQSERKMFILLHLLNKQKIRNQWCLVWG